MIKVLLYCLRGVFLVMLNLEIYALLELIVKNQTALFLLWSLCVGVLGALVFPPKPLRNHGNKA